MMGLRCFSMTGGQGRPRFRTRVSDPALSVCQSRPSVQRTDCDRCNHCRLSRSVVYLLNARLSRSFTRGFDRLVGKRQSVSLGKRSGTEPQILTAVLQTSITYPEEAVA